MASKIKKYKVYKKRNSENEDEDGNCKIQKRVNEDTFKEQKRMKRMKKNKNRIKSMKNKNGRTNRLSFSISEELKLTKDPDFYDELNEEPDKLELKKDLNFYNEPDEENPDFYDEPDKKNPDYESDKLKLKKDPDFYDKPDPDGPNKKDPDFYDEPDPDGPDKKDPDFYDEPDKKDPDFYDEPDPDGSDKKDPDFYDEPNLDGPDKKDPDFYDELDEESDKKDPDFYDDHFKVSEDAYDADEEDNQNGQFDLLDLHSYEQINYDCLEKDEAQLQPIPVAEVQLQPMPVAEVQLQPMPVAEVQLQPMPVAEVQLQLELEDIQLEDEFDSDCDSGVETDCISASEFESFVPHIKTRLNLLDEIGHMLHDIDEIGNLLYNDHFITTTTQFEKDLWHDLDLDFFRIHVYKIDRLYYLYNNTDKTCYEIGFRMSYNRDSVFVVLTAFKINDKYKGIILITENYTNLYSRVLKNTFDLFGSYINYIDILTSSFNSDGYKINENYISQMKYRYKHLQKYNTKSLNQIKREQIDNYNSMKNKFRYKFLDLVE